MELSEIKEFLGLKGGNKYDALIKLLKSQVISFIEGYTHNKIENGELTEYFDGGVSEIYLKYFPVNSITSIEYNNGTQATPDWQAIDAENYTIEHSDGHVIGSFSGGSQGLKVVYSVGYVSIPDDMKLLINELISKVFNQRRAHGKSSESMGDISVNWTQSLTFEQKMILQKYRKIRV